MGLERATTQVDKDMQGTPLIVGASGFVGRELREYFGCFGTSTSGSEGLIRLDATRLDSLSRAVKEIKPNILINCAGLADVDRAERDPELANTLNHTVVENLTTLQLEFGFRFVHISTDYVFSGEQGKYRESDLPAPVNEYGKSKLHGEAAAARSRDALILRISSPFGRGFGARKLQFFRFVTESLRTGKQVRALTDQTVTATFLPDLAHAIDTLVSNDARGIVHIGSKDPMSRYEFAKKVAQVIHADPDLVLPSSVSNMSQWVAARPLDTSLDVGLSEDLGVRYTPVEDAIRGLLLA